MNDDTLIHHFLRRAEEYPERIALVHNERRVTYGKLAENAGRLAAYLKREFQPAPEELIGVHGTRSIESITAMLGILRAGGAYVPLPADCPRARLSALIREAGLRCVLSDDTSPHRQVDAVMVSVGHVLLEEKQCLTEAAPQAEDRLAYVMFTSGSTGSPKGVMIEHRNVLAMLNGFEQIAPHTEPLVGSALVSIGFDVSVWEIFSNLCFGGTLHLIDHPEQVPELAAYCCRQGLTSAYLPPLILDDFIHEVTKQKRPAALSRLLVGVEPIPQQTLADLQQAVPRLRIVNGYGPTETTICATLFPFKGAREPQRRTPIGQALAGNQIHLVDEQLREVPAGQEGELIICGAGVGRGYYQDEQLTGEKFISNPFAKDGARCFRSGDYARALPDGNLEFVGRRDQQIKLNGYRVELGEIEAALMRFQGIQRALVLLTEPKIGVRTIVGFYTSAEGQALDPSELKSFLREVLPIYMVPRTLTHLQDFPLTANGKIDRQLLLQSVQALSAEKSGPLSDFEAELLRIFHEVMENDAFGMEANFFDLGGNSLQAARILARLRAQCGIDLSFGEFYDFTSLRAMALILEGRQHEADINEVNIPACARDERIPLTFIQKRTWFIVQSEPDNPSTHSPFALHLYGRLDDRLLQKSLETLIARNEILRTVFYVKDGSPYQKILPKVDFHLYQVNLTREKNPQAEARTRITDSNLETIDIYNAPPYRMTLYQLGREEYVLGIIIHHILIDGWSAELFKRELVAIYEQLSQGAEIDLPAAPIRYADFACWQQSPAFEQHIRAQYDYWQKKLAGQAGVAELPADKVRPASKTSNASTLWLTLEGHTLERLGEFCRDQQTTPFPVLLSAFALTLNRHTHQEVMRIGSFFANRPYAQVQSIMGPFINGVVLQVELNNQLNFVDLVRQIKQTVTEAQEYQEVPIEKVIELTKAGRDRSQRTLFGVVFNFVNVPQSNRSPSGLQVDYFNFDAGTVTYDLYIEINRTREGIRFGFEYNTDIYLKETVDRLVAHFQWALETCLQDPTQNIAQLDLLTDAEKDLLSQWNGARVPYPQNTPVHQLIEEQVKKTPQAVALQMDAVTYSYDALNRKANQLARVLVEQGLKMEDLVGISLPKSPDMLIAMLAVLKAGGAYLPLDPDYPQEHLEYILGDAKPVLMITDAEQSRLPFDKGRVIRWQDWQERIATEGEDNLDLPVSGDNLAYCIYTSGSSGKPKGVLIEHRPLVNFVLSTQRYYHVTANDRVLQFASLNFDTSAEEIYPALTSGATLVMRTRDMLDSLPHFLQRCRDWGITFLDLPTALWHELVLYLEKSAEAFPPDIRLVIIGGERVSPSHLATWHKLGLDNVHLDNTYGLTESTCVATRMRLTPQERKQYSQREVTIGKAIDNVNLYVLDETGKRVPPGVAGELYIGGDCLAREYLNLPELTAQRFLPDPFAGDAAARMYKSGDLVQWRPDGSLEYLGRSDEQIKIRGFRVEPGEIEAALLQFAGLADAVVLKRADPSGTEQLLAYLMLDQGTLLDEKALRAFLSKRLPKYMLPAFYTIMAEFPLTPSRKIDKNALPDPEWMHGGAAEEVECPQTPAEEKMLAIWQEALGRQGIGVTDNFFEIGGHSLLAARMMTEIERQFKVPIPLVTLLEKPSIRELADAITSSGWKPSWKSVVNLKSGGDQAPIFLIHAVGGDILSYRRLVIHLQESDHPIYGVRSQGLGGVAEPIQSVEDMAAYYLKEIREIQPRGPYYLGGYSFGGNVAYEMAQQLAAAGERVALLAMFDTVVVENMPPELQPSKGMLLLDKLERTWFVLRKWLGLSWAKKFEYFAKLIHFVKSRTKALVRREKYVNPQDREDHERWLRKPPAFQKVELANAQALRKYVARPYPGKVTLLKARQREWSELVRPEPLWRKLTNGQLDVYVCDGNHSSILLEPNVVSLADAMRDALAKADR
jgi:amino acid adenylation domain-containing protein